MPRKPLSRPAFTLVEILIVVIILGILATVVLASFSSATTDANYSTFATNLKEYATAFQLYHARNGDFPADGTPSTVPAGMEQYFDSGQWQSARPLGGQWDWDRNVFGVSAGVSVYRPNLTDAQMTQIDKMIDDGDLTTGGFRKRSNGFIFIIDP